MIDVNSIKLFDAVLLKDGRRADIVEVFDERNVFLADVEISPNKWDNIAVYPEDIERILEPGE